MLPKTDSFCWMNWKNMRISKRYLTTTSYQSPEKVLLQKCHQKQQNSWKVHENISIQLVIVSITGAFENNKAWKLFETNCYNNQYSGKLILAWTSVFYHIFQPKSLLPFMPSLAKTLPNAAAISILASPIKPLLITIFIFYPGGIQMTVLWLLIRLYWEVIQYFRTSKSFGVNF